MKALLIAGVVFNCHFNLSWVRSLRDQCSASNVAFHFKQIGGRTPSAGGCALDGREYKEFPRLAA